MSNIRVLIQDARTMLREILEQTISNEPDMELVQDPVVASQNEDGQSPSPDIVLVVESDSAAGTRAHALLERWPDCHVLMITEGGHKVLRYELLPQRFDLGEMSPGQVVAAIRSAVREQPNPHVH